MQGNGYIWLERFYRSLNLAGAGVAALEVISEDTFDEYTCATEDDVYLKDLGKMLFWSLMAARLLVAPTINYCIVKKNPKHCSSLDNLNLFEGMSVDAFKAMFFIILTARIYNINSGVRWSIAMFSLWPIFLFTYKQKDKKFEQGCHDTYLEHFKDKQKNKRWVRAFTAGECAFSAFSLAGSCGVVSSLCFNIFYSAGHKNDFPQQDGIIGALILMGFVVGAATQFHKRSYHLNHMSNEMIDIFYFCFMNMASTLACVKPQTMITPKGFYEDGWGYCVAFAVVSLVIAAGVTLTSHEESHEESRGEWHSGNQQGSFSSPAGESIPLVKNQEGSDVLNGGARYVITA